MGERLRTTAARHPGRALGVLAAVAVLGTALAAGWTDRLALSSTESKGAALRIQVGGSLPEQSPAFRVAVRTMRAQLSANPAVAGVRGRGSRDGAGPTRLVVRFEVGGRKRDAAIDRIEHNLDPGPLTIAFKGQAAAVRTAKDDAIDDLVLLLLALPLVALIAAATLGVRPAGAALLAAAAAAALASLACELLAGAFDVSWLALVGAGAGGILLALQLCAMSKAGFAPAALWGAGLAAAATFGATGLLGVNYLASLGLGGALGSLLAVPASSIAAGATGEIDDAAGGIRGKAAWREIGELLGWSRLMAGMIALLGLALLLFIVVPAGRLATAAIGAGEVPAISAVELGTAIGAAALVTALLGAGLGRRAGLALFATVVSAIPAAAVAGLLVLTFQEGWLEETLDYRSSGVVQLGSVVSAVTVVAALCAAQVVALAAAVRQADGHSGAERVGEALARCGPAATLACLAGVAAGAALLLGSRSFVKEFGLGVAAGLGLQLLIVQLLLGPALVRLTPGKAGGQ